MEGWNGYFDTDSKNESTQCGRLDRFSTYRAKAKLNNALNGCCVESCLEIQVPRSILSFKMTGYTCDDAYVRINRTFETC